VKIEVLGAGCARCQQLEELVRSTVQQAGIAAQIEHVTDLKRIASYKVLATPALVVEGQVKCAGRIPKRGEVEAWLGA
jgi:small redox-active disulfide protein 2